MKDKKMRDMFMEIWGERPHRSEISGKWLGKEPLSYLFDHLLEKEIYPEIKYEKWNIALVTIDEHTLKTNGYPIAKHKELIEQAKIKYQKWLRKDVK